MEENLAQQAVNAAIKADWKLAIVTNSRILKSASKDIDALNRLAKAYTEVGKAMLAKKASKKVLKLDPNNSIARKALLKLKSPIDKSKNAAGPSSFSEAFLEEPGKTKIVKLINLGDTKVTASLFSGDEVNLVCHSHKVSVTTLPGRYIGRLPDDIAARLRKLIKSGNTYKILVKSASREELSVFIQELSRSEKLKDYPSFPTEISHLNEDLVSL